MLRPPPSVLGFADSACLLSSVSAPIGYPSLLPSKEDHHVLVEAAPGDPQHVPSFYAPVASLNEFGSFSDAVVAGLPANANSIAMDHLKDLKQAADYALEVHRQIVREYISTNSPTPKQFDEWLQRTVAARDRIVVSVEGKPISTTRVLAVPGETYQQLFTEYGAIATMPEGLEKEKALRFAARRLVFREEILVRNKKEIASSYLGKLESVRWGLFAFQWVGPSVSLLTSLDNIEEFKKALAEVAGAVASYAAGEAAAWAAIEATSLVLLVVFELTPPGWVITGVGIGASIAAGWWFGEQAKSKVIKELPKLLPTNLP